MAAIPARFQGDLEPEQVWTISELTSQVKDAVENAFRSVWVSGEISNLSRPRSGHLYFSLKDAAAQLRAVLWRNTASRLVFEPRDGLEVVARGRLTVYQARGEYQLSVDHLQPRGMGALDLAFRQLKAKLDAEGLFDQRYKKSLPRFPRRLVLITSPTGAAVRDLLQVMGRRWSGSEIWIRPVPVQGKGASREIAAAIAEVNRLAGVDLLIVGRGGGSLEDLWAFNEEIVARAIFASRIPVISAVGHEIDVTIADLVADRRALTPSEAGELAVPSREELDGVLHQLRVRLGGSLAALLARQAARLEGLARNRVFRLPLEAVQIRARRVDELGDRLQRALDARRRDAAHRLARLGAQMDSLSPLKVLGRGYSLTLSEDEQTVIRAAQQVAPGERIVTRLARGTLVSRIERTEAEGPVR